ncbi:MAG: sugar phosphate nucleotidyltransferase [Oscillospiraceae bacterium]|nr:sugar phosphate nucleotidyltransferase [Oscillospiraceae bacterium]
MQIEDLIITEETTALEAMRKLDETGYCLLFVAPNGILKATLTDGDVRRHILKGRDLNVPVKEVANYNPKFLPLSARAKAKEQLLKLSLDAIPLLDKQGHIADVVFLNELNLAKRKKIDLPVVIMAGGLGTRLYPYTKILPKPLIPIGELPIVEHIINRFHSFGCNRFDLIVNYKKNMIKSYFNDLEKDYTVTYTDEEIPLGTGGGLSLLKGKINETFFLSNCDILIDADYTDIYNYHKQQGNIITMICALKNVTIPYGVIELGSEGEIKNVTEKPEMTFLTNAGVYLVEPCVIEDLPLNTNITFPDIMDNYRLKGAKVGVYPVSENSWMDMGQLEELDSMRRRMEEHS